MGDYISREDAIIALWKLSDRYYKIIVSPTVLAEKAFKAIPSADVEPVRHRRWENTRPDAPMFGFYYCSECGRKRTSPQDNYCPNCGARMDGEEDDGKGND